jgi:N-acyl amino acid synthase of PEP-CTERM/exosortase system
MEFGGAEAPAARPHCHLLSTRSYDAFEGVLADTEPLRNACFRVRHQVYCIERGYFPPADYPSGLETDEHDSHSLHGLLRHRLSGEAVGTVRLVLPRAGGNRGDLPVYSLVQGAGLDTAALPPIGRTAEISRFAISKSFRSHRALPVGIAGQASDVQVMLSGMALSLMALVVFRMSTVRPTEYLCAAMEPPLIRLLSRLGMRLHAVGPLIDYHGLRQPCIASVEDVKRGIEVERPDVWRLIGGGHPVDLRERAAPVAVSAAA